METKSIKLDVHVKAFSQARSLGFFSTVVISLVKEVEEFIINDKDDSVTSLGSYPDSSLHDPLISLKLPSFKPNYVYQLLHTQLHDHVLSEQISYKIVEAQQRQRSQSFYLPQQQQQPLFMIVSVKLTHKVYNVVSCNSALLATDLDQESQEEEESKTCAICLENLSRTEDYCEMPHCSHSFHEPCLTQWLINPHNNSCPLCRKPVDKQPE